MVEKDDAPALLPPYQEMLDLIDEPFVIIDRNYRIVAANQKYCDSQPSVQERRSCLGQKNLCGVVLHSSVLMKVSLL